VTATATATLPSGLVTFVMTDIEGSTKMFRRLGDAFPPVLGVHNALLREQWRAHAGAEVSTAGDSFIVAFASASAALAASVAAQRAVAAHAWPSDAVIRIRIGVHTGIAYPREGDYIALALNQAARVVGAANGGQVIASDDAVLAAGDDLSVRVEPIGAYRLRDFERSVRLSAVLGPDEHLDQPVSVRAVPADGHNLMPPLTSFVGRAGAVGDLRERLRPGRALTIVGPGGMGKTRLAVEVGLRVAPAWPDGVWMVDLSTVSDAGLVAAVSDAIGAPPRDGDEEAAVLAHLERRAALLLLDNCEHVVATSAVLARRVLAGCPAVGILATSRVPLAFAGEEVWRIEALQVVEDSVQLFVDRARARLPGFELNAADRPIVEEICRHVDGMPLAIELAAARLAVMSPAEILEGLQRRFKLLRTSDPTAAPRQRSIQALLDWGNDLLDPPEQAAFGRLSIFNGSFDLDAAAAAAGYGAIDPDDVAELVWSLADKSLLVVDRTAGATRYRMLETVRAYGADRLAEAGDADVARQRLADHYFERFPWAHVTRQVQLSGLAGEADTVAALVDGLLADGRTDDALALARMLAVVRHAHGRLKLALDGLEKAIDGAGRATPMLARAHVGAVLIATGLGQLDRAGVHLREAARLQAQFGVTDRWGHVSLARAEADIAVRGDSDEALTRVLDNLRVELDRPLALEDRVDVLFSLGEVEGQLGHASVIDTLTEVVQLTGALGDDGLLCVALSSLAEYDLRRGDTAAAARHQGASLQLAAELALPIVIACALIVAARLAEQSGGDETAVRLHAAADAMLEDAGFELLPSDRALSDGMHSRARERLGEGRFDTLAREGHELSLHRRIELAEDVFGRAAG
jgi:predicted ATPase/class 3 adenylate cyclase